MNLLDLVPSLDRHLRTYRKASDTDSKLAGFLADSIDALSFFWTRDYVVTTTTPYTYNVEPEIAVRDRFPIVLMASVIYKLGVINLVAFTDGDFSYNPFPRGKGASAIETDMDLLKQFGILGVSLATARTQPLRGFNNTQNRETYNWSLLFSLWDVT